jgi:hypothetical protein
VYIGETGDNTARRSTRVIYRVGEPAAGRARPATDTLRAEALVFRYSDGPRDVEALYVGGNGDMFLISKRSSRSQSGQSRPAGLYHIPAAAWGTGTVATASLVDSLPIVPGVTFGRQITDAALAPDHRHVAVRTYAEVFVFRADSATARIVPTIPPAVCDVKPFGDVGEGIAWADASGAFVLTNEGRHAPIHRVRCPLP